MSRDSSNLDEAKKRILARVSLIDLIGESVKLKVMGTRAIGLCPFHDEKTPSFNIYGDRYFCFGCKAKGDAIDYVRHAQPTLGFIDTLRYLAGKYGVDAPELAESDQRVRKNQEIAQLLSITTAAQEIFKAELKHPRGADARAYLRTRGFTDEDMESFGFGLTPAEGFGLTNALRLRGFAENDIKAAGLGSTSERTGRIYDFFRDRITLPIRDVHGRVITFAGRTTIDDSRKYLNGRDTRLFDKSETLFNLDRAKLKIPTARRAIVVEGYMDALQLERQGFGETVACMGTALSVDQLKQLRTFTREVYLLFDGDAAGAKASLAAVETALQIPDISTKVAVLPVGEDPDTFVQKNGAEALTKLLLGATELVEFAISAKLRASADLAVPEVVRRDFLPWLARVGDRMQRGYLIGKVAFRTGIPAADLERELRALTSVSSTQAPYGGAVREVDMRGRKSETAPEEQMKPLKPLDPVAFELVGHLYFSQPQELDSVQVSEFVKKNLNLDTAWVHFIEEFALVLEQGISPAQRTHESWSSGSIPEVSALLVRLGVARPAFVCTDRAVRLNRLIVEARKRAVRESIMSLKKQLGRSLATARPDPMNSDENSESKSLMEAITQMNQELTRLQKNVLT